MKYFFFVLTWVFVLGSSRILGDYTLGTFGILLMLGILLRFLPDDKTSKLRVIGWGLFYGSISLGVVAIVLAIWLSYEMSNH